MPKERFSQKVVGEDFEKRLLDSKKDAILLIQHPIKEKNSQLVEQYEELAFFDKNKPENSNLIFARYNGVNEAATFKSPAKLPALVYFKRPLNEKGEATGEEKEIITFEGVNELLLKSTKEHEVHERIRQFIHKCRASK